jgi:hypothetical protein
VSDTGPNDRKERDREQSRADPVPGSVRQQGAHQADQAEDGQQQRDPERRGKADVVPAHVARRFFASHR